MSDDMPHGYTAVHTDGANDFGRTIAPVFLDKAGGRLAFRVGDQHVNVAGFCHGGAVALFADHQVAVVRDHVAGLTGHTPTVSLRVDYIAPVRLGLLVEMHVTLVRHTRSLLFTQAVLTAAGENVGRADAIYRWYRVSAGDTRRLTEQSAGTMDASEAV